MKDAVSEETIAHVLAVNDVIADAMRCYAVRQTGNPKWSKAIFESEAYSVMGALARAGYEIVARTEPLTRTEASGDSIAKGGA